MHKLRWYGINGEVHRWIQNFLSDRTQRVVVEGVSSNASPVVSGALQGSVLFLFGTGYRSVKTEPEKKVTGPSVTTTPPIKYGLGYRFQTLTLKLTLTLSLKVTKMYAVQNDTGITVNTEL